MGNGGSGLVCGEEEREKEEIETMEKAEEKKKHAKIEREGGTTQPMGK